MYICSCMSKPRPGNHVRAWGKSSKLISSEKKGAICPEGGVHPIQVAPFLYEGNTRRETGPSSAKEASVPEKGVKSNRCSRPVIPCGVPTSESRGVVIEKEVCQIVLRGGGKNLLRVMFAKFRSVRTRKQDCKKNSRECESFVILKLTPGSVDRGTLNSKKRGHNGKKGRGSIGRRRTNFLLSSNVFNYWGEGRCLPGRQRGGVTKKREGGGG